MKIVFFGSTFSYPPVDRASRVLSTLVEGIADQGHHLVYFERSGSDAPPNLPFCRFETFDAWRDGKAAFERELADASALVVLSGFEPGPEAIDWLLEYPVPARVYYDLDPWATFAAFDESGASSALRADQIPSFDIVFSIAGGEGTSAFRTKYGAPEAVTMYECIDMAIYHARSPIDELACDLALVADRSDRAEEAFDEFLLTSAKALPDHRFIVAGAGWGSPATWPENVELYENVQSPVDRATLYSSARLALIPRTDDEVDFALPADLLEAAACSTACAVVDRPGLATMFKPGEEILVPATGADLVPYLTTYAGATLLRLGNLAEKRVLKDYFKLRTATKFEQYVARKFYIGHNG